MVTVNRFKTADGLSLAYADEGPRDGMPILCLAGLTRNMDDFAGVAARLSATIIATGSPTWTTSPSARAGRFRFCLYSLLGNPTTRYSFRKRFTAFP